MLCTVAQVFRAREGRPIVLFASPFSGGGGGGGGGEGGSSYAYTHKVLCKNSLFDLRYYVLVILVELPHFSSCISDLLDRQCVCLQILLCLGHNKRVE